MLVSTKAIVLSKLKYKDHDLIVKCYCKEFGVVSYLVRGALKIKKGKLRAAYFQPLSILELEADHKEGRSLQYIKEIKLHVNYISLHTNVVKSTIVMFLSEVLSGILKEEEENHALYDYLEASIMWFDHSEINTNFHLIFLLELSKYLGFYPEAPQSQAQYFNLEDGKFQTKETGIYCVTGENLTFLKQLLGTKFDRSKSIVIGSKQKREVLNMILLYFKLHLDGFKQPKSVAILNQVFS